jgi:NADPH2:quinone reductase
VAPADAGLTVRVVECREFGPVESLIVDERPSPDLRDGQVRIAVGAAGVNFVDNLFVQGTYQIKPPLPFVPGNEVAGRIVEVAPDVTTVSVGDRVVANVGLGGYASEAVAHHTRVMPIPGSLTDGQAATFVQSYITAWFALTERGRVRAGETLLVLGAGSGVGLAAVDVGASLGLRVMAAASTADKRELARSRGAEAVVDSTTEDVKALARDFGATTGRAGVDHLYDPIGGSLGEACLRALGEDGQYLVIGFVTGIPKLPANQILLRNRRVTGVDWGAWAGRHPDRNAELMAELLERIADGRLSPVEPATYPLEQAAQALRDLADRKVAGKVALVP